MGNEEKSFVEILARVELGQALTPARRRGGIWLDVIVPDRAPSSEAASEGP